MFNPIAFTPEGIDTTLDMEKCACGWTNGAGTGDCQCGWAIGNGYPNPAAA